MKKARLMLSALSLVAVLATCFAFTAKKFTNHFLYLGTKGTGVCTTQTPGVAISNGTTNFAASLVSLPSGCPDEYVGATTD